MANPLTVITSLGSGKSRLSNEGVVKRDWVPTGRIDFATKLNGNDDPSQPSDESVSNALKHAGVEIEGTTLRLTRKPKR